MARPIKTTTAEWAKRAVEVHGERYDYSSAVYLGSAKPISITCLVHGIFTQRASKHIDGQGCKFCNIDFQRKGIEKFIEDAEKKHGKFYDYSKVKFNNIHDLVSIICPLHGEFKQKAIKHQSGQGCKNCNIGIVWNLDAFIKQAIEVHGEKYNYDNSKYLNTITKLEIFCNNCKKSFTQSPGSHLYGSGCPYCAGHMKLSDDAFKELLFEAHNGEIIAIDEYVNIDTKITVKHLCGNVWKSTPNHLLNRNQGCRVCYIDSIRMSDIDFKQKLENRHNGEIIALEKYSQSKIKIKVKHLNCGKIWEVEPRVVMRCGCHDCAGRKSNEEFLRELKIVHNNEITALEPYITTRNKILVKHICGNEWYAAPSYLIGKETGCPWCATSKGNRYVADLLSSKNISFVREARFDSCKFKNTLPFDFYLPNLMALIEYDGEQHFKSVEFWGGELGLQDRILKDNIKNKWAKDNGFKLFRIRYDEDIEIKIAELFSILKVDFLPLEAL